MINTAGIVKEVAGAIIAPIANAYTSKQKRKESATTAQAKLAGAKQDGEKEITLTDAEWESVNADKANGTWKDEFVTIVVMMPFILCILAGIWSAIVGDTVMLDAVGDLLTTFSLLNVDVGFLMKTVVLAAVGLKIWRA